MGGSVIQTRKKTLKSWSCYWIVRESKAGNNKYGCYCSHHGIYKNKCCLTLLKFCKLIIKHMKKGNAVSVIALYFQGKKPTL